MQHGGDGSMKPTEQGLRRQDGVPARFRGAAGSAPWCWPRWRSRREPSPRRCRWSRVLVSTGLHALDYLRQGLRELGFVEGQDVVFAFRSADGNPRDLPGLARHLASLKPAVLFVAGPAALDAAVHATSSVPIVALDLETDPLRSGLVRSLERPRTNVTGLFLDQPAIAGKWFELLRQALPQGAARSTCCGIRAPARGSWPPPRPRRRSCVSTSTRWWCATRANSTRNCPMA